MKNYKMFSSKNLVVALLIGLITAFLPGLTLAQEVTGAPENLTPAECFDYYQFQSVMVDITPALTQTVSGAQMKFDLVATNQNDYPIVDGSIYVKIFQKQIDAKAAQSNGNFLVDQFFVKEGITLDAKETKTFEFMWTVPAWAPEGDYLTFTYFESAKKFNLLGLSFTDDITGGRGNFKVKSDFKNSVMIDKNNVKVGGKKLLFATPSPRFTKDEAIAIELPIKNPTKTAQEATITYDLYYWDSLNNSQKIDTKKETINLKAGETKKLAYQITDTKYPVYYLVATTKWHDFSSIADIRVIREGLDRGRINFPGIKSFPIKKGEANTLFVCAHSMGTIPGNSTSTDEIGVSAPIQGKLEISLVDGQNNQIKKYAWSGEITSEMMGFKADFTPDKNYSSFQIKAALYDASNQIMDEATLKYDCNEINKTKCLQDEVAPGVDKKSIPYKYIGGGVLLLLIIAMVIFFMKRRGGHNEEPPTSGPDFPVTTTTSGMMILMILLGAGMMLLPSTSVQANSVLFEKYIDYLFYQNQSTIAARNSFYTITYNAYATDDMGNNLSDGDRIPKNAKITFGYDANDFKTTGSDTAFWFTTGGTADSPYGHWKSEAVYPYSNTATCSADDYYENRSGNLYRPLSVSPPSITINTQASEADGTLGNCVTGTTNKTCEVMKDAGSIRASISFGETFGYHYANRYNRYRSLCEYGGKLRKSATANDFFKLEIPGQAINFQFSAIGTSPQPGINLEAPTITGPSMGTPEVQYSFEVKSNSTGVSNITYQVDWDNDTFIDALAENIPFDQTGVVQKTWAAPGSYTFKVKSIGFDASGNPVAESEWASHTINISTSASCEVREYWTACSASCGGGSRDKIRITNTCSVEVLETNTCNPQPCGKKIIEVPPGP